MSSGLSAQAASPISSEVDVLAQVEPAKKDNATDWICIAVVSVLSAVWFSRVLTSHLADADGYLVHIAAVSDFDRISVVHVGDLIASYYRAVQPGWFPLGALPLTLWLIDWPIAFVKVPQFVLVIASFATFALVVRRLFGSRNEAIIAVVLAICSWQFRAPHDPVIGTSLVTPWSAELTFLSFAGWLTYRDTGSRLWLSIGVTALFIALLTDPMAWGFGCLLVAMILLYPLRRRVVWPIAAMVVLAISIGSILGPPAAPWQHKGNYAANVLAQLLAAIPTSYRAFGYLPIGQVASLWHGIRFSDDRFVFVPPISTAGWCAVAACTFTTFCVLILVKVRNSVTERRAVALFGLGFWLIPALFLGSPGVWQSGLPFGQAFAGVYLEYFGVAVLVTLAISRIQASVGTAAKLTPSLVVLCVFILCYGNERADAVALERSERLDDTRSLMQRAATAGFFGSIREGSTIAVAPSVPFANGLHRSLSDAKYALYHYSHLRFSVSSADRLPSGARDVAWLLRTSRATDIFVSLTRLSGESGRAGLSDSAFGYSVLPKGSAEADDTGKSLVLRSTPLSDGRLIFALRRCGTVPITEVFEPSLPTLSMGAGFGLLGPSGYNMRDGQDRTVQWREGGNALRYPKLLMEEKGSLYITPTTCRLGIIHFTADYVTGARARLTIAVDDHTIYYPVWAKATSYTLSYLLRSHRPVRIDFATDGPIEDFNPNYFRYERDVPRDLRLVLQPSTISEEPISRRPPIGRIK